MPPLQLLKAPPVSAPEAVNSVNATASRLVGNAPVVVGDSSKANRPSSTPLASQATNGEIESPPPLVLFAILNRQGDILSVNDAWLDFGRQNGLDIKGQEAGFAVGANYLAVCRCGAQQSTEARRALVGVEQVLAGQRQAYILEFTCSSQDKEFVYLMTASKMPGRDDLFYLNYADITRYRRSAEQLQEMHTQVANVARLATGAELVAGIAHEVNQPLFAIVNFAKAIRHLLGREALDRARLGNYCDEIAAAGLSAGKTLRNMRQFAEVRPISRRPEKLPELLSETLELLTYELRRREIGVVIEVEPQLEPVLIDRLQIQHVLVNVLRNAWEAMENLGRTSHKICVSATVEAGYCWVSFRDNGPGFEPEMLKHFTTAFFTKSSGLGLGLLVCNTIIISHGGQLQAVNEEGGGATIRFSLPLARSNTL
jgi:two-component system sensor kinase FixL